MDKKFSLEMSKKAFPIILEVIAFALMVAQFLTRLNFVSVICVAYCCILSAIIFLSLIIKKKVYISMIMGYVINALGVFFFHVIFGADAGFGAFTSGHTGWSTVDNPLFAGPGSFLTRFLGNALLSIPIAIAILSLFFVARKNCSKVKLKGFFTFLLSVVLPVCQYCNLCTDTYSDTFLSRMGILYHQDVLLTSFYY